MALQIELFTQTSPVMAHPTVTVTVPAGYKILGGGAFDHYSEPGNMLTAAYPNVPYNTWIASGKDHEKSSPAAITGYALALYDPQNAWDVRTVWEVSAPSNHPSVTALLPEGYLLTGGGAYVNYHGAGNLLTASFPNSDSSWEARSKDHDVADPAQITAYAIGIKSNSGVRIERGVFTASDFPTEHPTATAQLGPGWILCGGGAFDNWEGAGNLLTASYPQGSGWVAAGKDHLEASPASITAYAIGLYLP